MHFKALCNGLSMPLPNQQLRVTDEVTHPELKTLLRVIRLTSFLLLAAFLQVSARGYSQTVTLREKSAPLEKVFSAIEKQTGFKFYYRLDLLDSARRVDINVRNVPLTEALDKCIAGQAFTYEIIEKTIVLKPKQPAATVQLTPAYLPPAIDVHGRIVNEEGDPVAAISVKVKGTDKGTTTNANGEFQLEGVDADATLLITGINIDAFEINVSKRNDIGIYTAKTKIGSLQEVVINKGYYTTKQKLNTGNVSTVKSEVIEKQPVTNPLAAIEGRIPGLDIRQENGVPGGGFVVRIRGQNSIANGNDPLYVIDGVPYSSSSLSQGNGIINNSPFNYFNPSDIESIEVLKDADATAIYGSRGANGVILITTKKAKAGKMGLNVNAYTGVAKVTHMMKLLNTRQYLDMRREAFKNDGANPGARDYDLNGKWDTTRYTDWQNELIGGTANYNDVQASFSGGNINTQFLLGGGYHKETTVFPGNFSDKKASVHLSLVHNSTDQRFNATITLNYTSDNNTLLNSDMTPGAIKFIPVAPALYDSTGKLNWANSTWTNPLVNLLKKYDPAARNLVGSGQFSYQLMQGLTVKTGIAYTNTTLDEKTLIPISSYNPILVANFPENFTAQNQFASSNSLSWSIEPQISYHKSTKIGTLDFLVGASFQQRKLSSTFISGSGITSDVLIENIASAPYLSVSNNYTDYRYGAVFGRAGYNYKDRYLLNLIMRRDGSSRFGPGRQFGNFGAVGAAWIFSNENFINNGLPFLSFGKIRASYGITGNDQTGDYQYLSTYSSTQFPYQGLPGLLPTRLYNPDFGWETNKKLEAGLELGFLKDRMNFKISYYRSRSSNQLVGYSLPPTTGGSSIVANLPATIQNTGVEMQLDVEVIRNALFSWNSGLVITIPRNLLISYPNLAGSSYANTYVIGQSLYAQKVYQVKGVDLQTGIYTFATKSPGIPVYPDDLATVKDIAKDYYGGIQNTFKYKQWSLDIFIQFVKQTSYNFKKTFALPGTMNNQPVEVLDRWQKPDDRASFQKFTRSYGTETGSVYNAYTASDQSIGDASYARLKNLSLSYQLPSSLLKRWHLQGIRLYLQGQNLFTFTKYIGLDPELPFSQSLPTLRVYTAGFQLTL